MKPTILEVLDKFVAYYRRHPAWGSLHVVLGDGNIDDGSVEFCRTWAAEHDDQDGVELCDLLMRMSKTQRGKIGNTVDREIYRQEEVTKAVAEHMRNWGW